MRVICLLYNLGYIIQMANAARFRTLERWNIIQSTDDSNWLENSSADVGWPSSSLHVFYAPSLEKDFPEDAAMPAKFEVAVNKKDVEVFAAEWIAANVDRVLGLYAN
jgi:hypothetical protein